jgi:hypothetical protein
MDSSGTLSILPTFIWNEKRGLFTHGPGHFKTPSEIGFYIQDLLQKNRRLKAEIKRLKQAAQKDQAENERVKAALLSVQNKLKNRKDKKQRSRKYDLRPRKT